MRDGYDPAYGARPLRRTVQRLVQDPLAMQILEGAFCRAITIRVDRRREDGSDALRTRPSQKTSGCSEKLISILRSRAPRAHCLDARRGRAPRLKFPASPPRIT